MFLMVLVADYIVAVQITDFTQPSGQFYQGLIGCICKFTGFVRVADFDGNGIFVPVVTGRGFFMQRNTRNDLAFQPDHKAGTDLGRMAGIIVPVLLGGCTGICHIVDNDVLDAFQIDTTAGIAVHLDDLLIHPIRRRSSRQFKDLFPGNDLVLINMPSYRQKHQKQNESKKPFHGLFNLFSSEFPVDHRD